MRTPPATDAPWFIVMNAGSGRQNAEKARSLITSELSVANRQYTVFVAKRGKDVRRMAEQAVEGAKRHNGYVIVAGGDGTINTVANAAYRANCGLGLIPLGTFNYTARTYGIPDDPGTATRALLNATVQPVEAGMVNDRLFLVNAGLGFHSYVFAQREKHKAKLGRSRAVAALSALLSLADLPTSLSLSIEHDGKKELMNVAALFVGNNPLQLQQAGLIDGDKLPPSQLLAVALAPIRPLQSVGLMLRGTLGKLKEDEHVRSFPLHEMSVRRRKHSNRPFRIAIDGEVTMMKGPLTFRVTPRPLMLLMPQVAT